MPAQRQCKKVWNLKKLLIYLFEEWSEKFKKVNEIKEKTENNRGSRGSEKSVDKGEEGWYNSGAVAGKRKAERTAWYLENRIVKQNKTWRSNFETTGGLPDNGRRRDDGSCPGQGDLPNEIVNERAGMLIRILTQEFDPGSGRTLAACLIHASRTEAETSVSVLVANGWVTRE